MRTGIRIPVGALVGIIVGYVVWEMVLVPASLGFSDLAYQLRYWMGLLGLNRLHFPWAWLAIAAATGAVIGWGTARRQSSSS